MKKQILVGVLVAIFGFTNVALAGSFSDVSNDNPYYVAIESLKNLGVISGYGDGTFGPNNLVNRAEALKMILASAEIQVPEVDTTEAIGFSDVAPNVWFLKYLKKAKNQGIVNGNPDGTFTPGRSVIRAEFIKMLLNSFGTDLSKHQNLTENVSSDVLAGDWFVPYMSYAKSIGLVSLTLDDKLLPGKELTRGECAEIIYKMLITQKGGDAQKMLNIAESQLVTVLVKLNQNNPADAIEAANAAVFYTEKAMEAAPNNNIADGANRIARSFRGLCFAYRAGAEGNQTELKEYVEAANKLAAEAVSFDNTFAGLQTKVKQIGETLLSQITE